MFYPDVPAPDRVYRTQWGTSTLTRGSYSFVADGADADDIEDLVAPLFSNCCGSEAVPRLMFCGEATSRNFYSTVHGAALSGLREANRLAVALGLGALETEVLAPAMAEVSR